MKLTEFTEEVEDLAKSMSEDACMITYGTGCEGANAYATFDCGMSINAQGLSYDDSDCDCHNNTAMEISFYPQMGETTDQETLLKIAKKGSLVAATEAISRMTDLSLLAEIAASDLYHSMKMDAFINRLIYLDRNNDAEAKSGENPGLTAQDVLAKLLIDNGPPYCGGAIRGLTNQDVLAKLAISGYEQAIRRLEDQDLLFEIAGDTKRDKNHRKTAVNLITDLDKLIAIVKNEDNIYPDICIETALQRITREDVLVELLADENKRTNCDICQRLMDLYPDTYKDLFPDGCRCPIAYKDLLPKVDRCPRVVETSHTKHMDDYLQEIREWQIEQAFHRT